MKLPIILAILVILIAGCAKEPTTSAISGTSQLIPNETELSQLGLAPDLNETNLQQMGIANGTNCWTDNAYSNIVDSSTGQYSICSYVIPSLNTSLIIQLQKFDNLEALNGSYQYDSSHYYSAEGLLSENTFGDQSRFRVNSEKDYGGEFNPPGVYFYHLWICKDLYLIHITTSGTSEDAKGYIEKMAQQILAKFE